MSWCQEEVSDVIVLRSGVRCHGVRDGCQISYCH